LLRGGQVICGKNATRFSLNNAMRRAAGFNGSALPTGPGEKVICLKNDNALGLLNGMFVELDDIEQVLYGPKSQCGLRYQLLGRCPVRNDRPIGFASGFANGRR
jgi:hypothetical protein